MRVANRRSAVRQIQQKLGMNITGDFRPFKLRNDRPLRATINGKTVRPRREVLTARLTVATTFTGDR